jgi:hypothetical protein
MKTRKMVCGIYGFACGRLSNSPFPIGLFTRSLQPFLAYCAYLSTWQVIAGHAVAYAASIPTPPLLSILIWYVLAEIWLT